MATLGNYELLEILGDGGMGTVWRGRDLRLDRPVAVKVLHRQLLRNPDVVRRFKSEAVIQAKLSHPGIVAVLDFIAEENCLAIVMELMSGPSLEALIQQHGPIPPLQSVRIMIPILRAVAWAHERGLVHRDIKPSNILGQQVEQEYLPKITDFGVAKVMGPEKHLTVPGAKMGTLAYMSPEQILQPRQVDRAADIYALGATLHEMLTGQAPFDAATEYTLMEAITKEPAPAPSSINAGIPRVLDEIVLRALAKQPDARFASCEQMRHALEGFEHMVAEPVPRPAPSGSAHSPYTSRPSGVASSPAPPSPGTVPIPPPARTSPAATSSPTERSSPQDAGTVPGVRRARRAPPRTGLLLSACAALLGVFVVFYLLQTGSLLLQGSPAGAAAYVDGRFVGRVAGSPPGGSLRVPKLKAGYHQLRLDMPDFIPEERGFKIARRAQTSLSMTLHPCTGMLRLSSDPPSQATVRDSQKVLWTGGTPATISLPVGEYRVGLSVQDGATWSTTATIRANRTCDVSHHFPRPGTLRVVGSCWGEVFVDGTRRGETPFVANLPPGGYAVRVTGPCGEYQEAVVVVENQDVVVNPQY